VAGRRSAAARGTSPWSSLGCCGVPHRGQCPRTDRDGAHPPLAALRQRFSPFRLVWVDVGYTGRLVVGALFAPHLGVVVIKRIDDTTGFVVLARLARGPGWPPTSKPSTSREPASGRWPRLLWPVLRFRAPDAPGSSRAPAPSGARPTTWTELITGEHDPPNRVPSCGVQWQGVEFIPRAPR